MILVKPSFEIMAIMYPMDGNGEATWDGSLELIERAGRTCYKSEDKITEGSAEKFVKMVRDRGHHSVIEHSAATVKIICDRGVTHEIVRHRLAAYSQESTRYCDYSKDDTGIGVIPPFFFDADEKLELVYVPLVDINAANGGYGLSIDLGAEFLMNSFDVWFVTCLWTQWGYNTLRNVFGRSAQQARSVLPNSLKTEIVITANFREWLHIFTLRCSKAAHPQMREIMIPLRDEFRKRIPVIFDDMTENRG